MLERLRCPNPKAGAPLCHQVSGSPSTFSWKPAAGYTMLTHDSPSQSGLLGLCGCGRLPATARPAALWPGRHSLGMSSLASHGAETVTTIGPFTTLHHLRGEWRCMVGPDSGSAASCASRQSARWAFGELPALYRYCARAAQLPARLAGLGPDEGETLGQRHELAALRKN